MGKQNHRGLGSRENRMRSHLGFKRQRQRGHDGIAVGVTSVAGMLGVAWEDLRIKMVMISSLGSMLGPVKFKMDSK